MELRPDEISSLIKKQIQDYRHTLNLEEVGTVFSVGDGTLYSRRNLK